MKVTDRVAAVGVGYSTTGRRTGLTSWQLAIQACKAAMDDAGMTPADIDGVALLWGVAGPEPAGLDVIEPMGLGYTLGISPLNWYAAASPSPAYVGAAVQGIAAIRSGFAHTVLTVRIINQRSSSADVIRETAERGPDVAIGDRAYTAPYGFAVGGMIPSIAAFPAQRHMDVYGTTEEQFGAHVVSQRYNASLNEDALLRERISVEDYLRTRYIAKPVRLLDCDYPVDSASAVIYTSGDRARDWAKKPVWVDAAAYSSIKYMDFDMIDMNESSPFHAANELWNRTESHAGRCRLRSALRRLHHHRVPVARSPRVLQAR